MGDDDILTDVWNLDVTHAAGILNIYGGVTAILPIGLAFLVDSFMGDFSMLLFSSIAYTVGLGLLSMSTPPVTGRCSEYDPECIDKKQKLIFYIALTLIAVGVSGHTVSLASFIKKQVDENDATNNEEKTQVEEEDDATNNEEKKQVEDDDDATNNKEEKAKIEGKKALQCIGFFSMMIALLAGVFALSYVKPWSLRFGIPAIFSLVATLLFISGSCSYKHHKPEGSPLTTVFRVFVASTSKLFHPFPRDANKMYEKEDTNLHVDRTPSMSFLEKAAILLPNQPIEQQERNRWRLCGVSEVEETKSIIRMIPMWITFIMCGIVSSIGSTYFLEQAKNMNPKLGSWSVTLPILLMFYDMVKQQFAGLGSLCNAGSRKYAAPIGIAVAMMFSVLCCITAAKVETRRLYVIWSHGLLDKPDERIPMSVFWMLPQFFLLGALDGIFGLFIGTFFKDQAPSSMKSYLIYFTNGVVGLGVMASVLTVYVAGKISERGGKSNWFQDTLNKSRLDNYYWALAALSAANLLLYIVIASCCYTYRNPNAVDEEKEPQDNDESLEPYEENTDADCCYCLG